MAIGASSRSVDARRRRAAERFFAAQGLARGGGGEFRFLEELDDMGGRYLDNADFFAVADPANLGDEQLYDLLTTEYPQWVAQARGKGLLRRAARGRGQVRSREGVQ